MNEATYSIPMRYRKMENMHILFWLIKDISWCIFWKPMGMLMIIPTLVIAVIISYRTRHIKSELAHNLAVTLWITANSLWMISEFFHFDSVVIWYGIEGKFLSLIPFVLGLAVLVYYYLIQKPQEVREAEVVTL